MGRVAAQPPDRLQMVSDLRGIMDAIATGGIIPGRAYERLRRALLRDGGLAPYLPKWLRTARTSDEFAEMLRAGLGARDQLGFIQRELEPAYAYLEDLEFNRDDQQNVDPLVVRQSLGSSRTAEQLAEHSPVGDPKRDQPAEHEQDHLLQVIFEHFHGSGEWPLLDRLRHELDRADDDLDVVRVGRELDPALGTVTIGYEARASLTIHGVARCSGSGLELDDILRTMVFAYQQFRSRGPGARLASKDLEDALGLDPLRLRRTFELIQWLPGVGGGEGGAPDSWSREITPDITKFRRVKVITDLLAAAPRSGRMAGPVALTQPLLSSKPVAATESAEQGSVALVSLHPAVAEIAGPLFSDGYHAQAAFEAFKALEVRLRKLSGLDLSGRDLAAQALSGDPARVVVSRHDGRTGADEQDGLRFIFMGVMQGLRNPGGHELDALDHQEALEELAVASLLMRWLDTSRTGDASPDRVVPPRQRARQPVENGRDLPISRQAEAPPRLIVLRELQEMSHRQARTSAVLDLELRPLADRSSVPFESLQDALVDLLAEGLAEPYAATMGQSAEQGACRITGDGVRELARLLRERGR